MTKQQLDKLDELEQIAINAYLDKTDFNVSEWLDKNDSKEHCKLFNADTTDISGKMCLCGMHEEWK